MPDRDELLTRNRCYPIDSADRIRSNMPTSASAQWTGEIRRPKAGEWYLKAGEWSPRGEFVFAYRAAANLTAEHAIAELSPEPAVSGR